MFETRRSARDLDPLEGARQEFSKNRKIIISSSTPITLDEAKEFLADFECTDIVIKKLRRRVIATLKNSADVAKLNRKLFFGNKVDVQILPNNKLLCVAQLPLRMGERGFAELVNNYGEIERCFLMLTKNGTSKGYGLVEFTCNRQESETIRCKLERKLVYDSVLHCDFIKETITDFDQLNSTCLYVGNLPPEFNDDEQLREAFDVVAKPLFCCVARENDLPLGFAVVEFDKPEQAEETFDRVQDCLIGGQMIDVKYCIPGHSVPEAFSRHLRFLDGRDGVEIIPSGLPVRSTDLCHPPPVCSALIGVLEKYSPVLKDFRRVIFHLQKHLDLEQKQQMSTKPGILGEPPKVKSILDNAGLQASLLAVMLGHQLKQSLPDDLTISTISSMLPKDFNLQLICTSSRIAEATALIRAMCSNAAKNDDTDDDTDDDNEDDKNDKAPEVSKIIQIEDEMETASRNEDKPAATPEPESLSSMSVMPSAMSNANLFSDLNALLAIIQSSCNSKSKHPFVVQRKTARSSDAGVQPAKATTAEAEHKVLGKSAARKARRRLVALGPLAHPATLKLLNDKAVSHLLGCAVMKLIQDSVFAVPTKLEKTPAASSSQPVLNLMDVQIDQSLLSRMVGSVNMGDGHMDPEPTAPTGFMSAKLGLESPGTRIMEDAPGKGILGSPPVEQCGSVGHRQWDEMEVDRQVPIMSNFSYPGARGFGRGVRTDFGGGDFRCGNSNGNGDERFGFGGIRSCGGSGNEKFSSYADRIVDSCVPNAAAEEVDHGGNVCSNGGKYFRGGKCIQGFGRGSNGLDRVSWKSGNQWGGSNHCGQQKRMRIQGIDSWNGGRSGEVDQMNWNGGMENLRWDNAFRYQDLDLEHERMALGGRGAGRGGGGAGAGEGIGLNEFDNGGSWPYLQQGYYVHGPKQCPLPSVGVAAASFEIQAGSQVYESYYTGSGSSRGHEQPKAAAVCNGEDLEAFIGSRASTDYRMEHYSRASGTVSSSHASSEFSGQGQHGRGRGAWPCSQGYHRQGHGQYGLKQGQYGLCEEQHGKFDIYRTVQRPNTKFRTVRLTA